MSCQDAITPEVKQANDLSFLKACQTGNLPEIQFLVQNKGFVLDEHNMAGIQRACLNGHVNIVKYLLTSPELAHHIPLDSYLLEAGIADAAIANHLEIIRYLVASPELSEHVNLHNHNEKCLIVAFSMGHLNIIDYLLASPEIIQAGQSHANIHAREDEIFVELCKYNEVDIISHLLTSPTLESYRDDFSSSLFKSALHTGSGEIIHKLLIDFDIALTEEIQAVIQKEENLCERHGVMNLLTKRNMHHKLEAQLDKYDNAMSPRKMKL